MSTEVLDGASVVAAAMVALFFARFRLATGDRFFAFFAVAFLIFALDRALIVALPGDSEVKTAVYLVRATAFATIIWAVLDKNRRQQESAHRTSRPRSAATTAAEAQAPVEPRG